MKPAYYIGLISGTSMDGVDCVLVDMHNNLPTVVDFLTHPIPAILKKDLLDLCRHPVHDIRQQGDADIAVAKLFSEAVNTMLGKHQLVASDINAIGSHGQTIWHEPPQVSKGNPFTIQIGDPNTIAYLTGITTVADFRRKDMAAGGQGAPIVPAFHNEIFRSLDTDRVILNLGGFANITVLPKNSNTMSGYDTGPANVLLDSWILEQQGKNFDKDGIWADSGTVNKSFLSLMLKEPYFSLPSPKSTGRELFNLAWIQKQLAMHKEDISAADVQTTLLELSAVSIANAIQNHFPNSQIIACGGGANNPVLLGRLQDNLPEHSLVSCSKYGLDPDAIEATAFAWLANKTLNREKVDFSAVTGASQSVIAGGVYFA